MFAMLAIYTTALFSILAAAGPVPSGAAPVCSTGNLMCCNTITSYSEAHRSGLYSDLLGLDLLGKDKGHYVGQGCSPITVVGTSSGTCRTEAVCCKSASKDGLVNLGCMPVTL